MNTLKDFKFQCQIAGGDWQVIDTDVFPFNDLDTFDGIGEALVDEWDNDTRSLVIAGIAPALFLGFSATEEMADLVGVQPSIDHEVPVSFQVTDGSGQLLYISPTTSVCCIQPDTEGRPLVGINPTMFTMGLGKSVFAETGELDEDTIRTIDKHYPCAARLNDKLKKLSRADMEALAMLTMSAIGAVMSVLGDHTIGNP